MCRFPQIEIGEKLRSCGCFKFGLKIVLTKANISVSLENTYTEHP